MFSYTNLDLTISSTWVIIENISLNKHAQNIKGTLFNA
jgi:hypothetical protein